MTKRNADVNVNVNLNVNFKPFLRLITNMTDACMDVTSW